MFERAKAFFHGLGKLIQDPWMVSHYESRMAENRAHLTAAYRWLKEQHEDLIERYQAVKSDNERLTRTVESQAYQLKHMRGQETEIQQLEVESPMLEPVGKIEYGSSGKAKTFYNTEEYLQEYEEAINLFGVAGGIKATTITRDPATHKAVDDLIYGAVGEENPHDFRYYQEKYGEVQPPETTQTLEEGPDMELEP